MTAPIHGYCDSAFQHVADAFEENFRQHNEIGASCYLSIEGERLVDIWGGHLDVDRDAEWQKDTLSLVFSCTKAALALCAHILIDRGLLDLDEKVSTYWPDYGCNGKENTTVRMVLNHSSAVPALRDPVKPGGIYDFEYMASRFAAEEPFWEVGSDNGYHMLSFGWTVGELVRRLSGKSIGTFFKQEIADPYGLDFFIGLPESEFPRVSKMIPYTPDPKLPQTDFVKALLANHSSIQFLALLNVGGHFYDAPEAWRAEIGGAGGIANARSLAGMFTPLVSGKSYLSPERISDMRKTSAQTQCDRTLLIPTRFGQGFMLPIDNRHTIGEGNSAFLGQTAFGHIGMGGSIGFADTACKMSFGYSMNRMGGGILLNERGQALADAAYKSLGYKEIIDGTWRL